MGDYSSPQLNNRASLERSGSPGLQLQLDLLGCEVIAASNQWECLSAGCLPGLRVEHSPFSWGLHCVWEPCLVTVQPFPLLGHPYLG